jgi:hypothetical protein
MPTPVYGVVILVVILVCLIILVRQGLDAVSATGVIVTVALAAVDMTRRLQRGPHSDDSPFNEAA